MNDVDPGPFIANTVVTKGRLASLHVNVEGANKFNIETCKNWIIHTVLRSGLGTGGAYLQEVEMVFGSSSYSVERETSGKGVCLQSIQRNEERTFWVYSQGQIYEGPFVGGRGFR